MTRLRRRRGGALTGAEISYPSPLSTDRKVSGVTAVSACPLFDRSGGQSGSGAPESRGGHCISCRSDSVKAVIKAEPFGTSGSRDPCSTCAVERRDFPVGDKPTRQLSLRPVAIGAVVEVTKRLKPSVWRVTLVTQRVCGLQRVVNAEQAPKRVMWKSRPGVETGKAIVAGEVSETCTRRFHRGIGGGTIDATREAPRGGWVPCLF